MVVTRAYGRSTFLTEVDPACVAILIPSASLAEVVALKWCRGGFGGGFLSVASFVVLSADILAALIARVETTRKAVRIHLTLITEVVALEVIIRKVVIITREVSVGATLSKISSQIICGRNPSCKRKNT